MPYNVKPIDVPADFVENAKTMGIMALSAHYGMNKERIRRISKLVGVKLLFRVGQAPPARKMPDDFHLYADSEPLVALMERYKAGNPMVTRWRAELGLGKPGQSNRKLRPMPDGFVTQARGMSIHSLERHYGARNDTIKRWMQEAGVSTRPRGRPTAGNFSADRGFKSAFEPVIDPSIAGQAQRFLQKTASVYKAEVAKKGAAGWIVWGKLMTTEQMMAKAESLGWSADSWTRLAA